MSDHLAATYSTLSKNTEGIGTTSEHMSKYQNSALCKAVRVKEWKDIRPLILVTMKSLLINDVLVYSSIRIDPTSNVVVSKIGNSNNQKSSTRIDIVDWHLASCFGIIEDVFIECFDISISMDLHVIILEVPSCSLVLVRPWMQELLVIQHRSMINLLPSKRFNLFYDLYL